MAKTTYPNQYVSTPRQPQENIFEASKRRRSEKQAFDEYQKQQEALRQQYLYDKPVPAEVLPEGVSGPTRPETTSMNPFIKSMRDSGVPEPVVQFLQNNPQATKEDIQSALTVATQAAKPQGFYGGVQWAIDAKDKNKNVPWSIDEKTRQPIRIDTQQPVRLGVDIIPTIPMSTQVVTGGNIVQIPSRGAPGVTPRSTGTGLQVQPSPEEAVKVGTTDNAFAMGNRMMELVDSQKVNLGMLGGRYTKGKAITGVGLNDQEAEMVSLEENLSNALLEAMRGAQVGPKEQELFNKSLPRINQPEKLFKANIRTTMANIRRLNERVSTLRPVPNVGGGTPKGGSTLTDEQREALRKRHGL